MLTTDRAAGIALTLFGAYVLWESRTLPMGNLQNPGPAAMPVVLAGLVIVFGVLTTAAGARAPSLAAAGWMDGRHAVVILAVCAFVALGLERLGYRVTMILMLLFLVGVLERKGWIAAIVSALALSLGTFYLFDTLLRVPLPRGHLGF